MNRQRVAKGERPYDETVKPRVRTPSWDNNGNVLPTDRRFTKDELKKLNEAVGAMSISLMEIRNLIAGRRL